MVADREVLERQLGGLPFLEGRMYLGAREGKEPEIHGIAEKQAAGRVAQCRDSAAAGQLDPVR